jgi:hypothetical protein
MSSTVSAAWSHPVSSPCYTEHGQRCGAILSGHITTVAMSRSGQLGLCCTVEPNCSSLSACLAGTLVTCDHALDTCEPNCVPGAVRSFFIPVVHSPLGGVGYMAAPELSSQGVEAGATWQCRSPPQQGGVVRSHGTRGSAGAHLGREARSEAEEHVTALKLNSARRRGPGPRGSIGAHLSKEVSSGAAGHMAAPEPTSTGRCGPKLQLMWQRIDACTAPYLNLELVCGGTRSSRC